MSKTGELANAVGYYRGLLEAAWADDTAHAEYRPLPETMPVSYGQCVPSSCVLIRELRQDFPYEPFALCGGRVLKASIVAGKAALIPIIKSHVWIGWQRPRLIEAGVIDATSDQAENGVLPPYVVATHDQLNNRGVAYHACGGEHGGVYPETEGLIGHLSQQEPNVRERIAILQTRFDRLKR